MQNPFLIGKNIYLRPIEETDAPTFIAWLNNPDVTRYLETGRFPLNLLREREYIQNLYKDDRGLNLAIVLKDGDKHIGAVGLDGIHPIDRKATFGIFIGDTSCWEKGYGTEATQLMIAHGFNTLNLNRIRLRVMAYNPRAICVYKKVGFVQEGIFRKENYRNGAYHDVIAMAVLKTDWQQKTG